MFTFLLVKAENKSLPNVKKRYYVQKDCMSMKFWKILYFFL